jgi:pimeloyl-ACP methyl ester carboxylesterase
MTGSRVCAGVNAPSRTARLAAASLILLLAFVVPKVAAAHDATFTIDGQNLHIEILGESGPTIVFEAGLGNDISTWKLVAEPVAGFARVVLYDRAGLGKSLPFMTKSATTADEVATRLHKLLETAGLRPPWIMVGHSLGGLYVQMFARKYPREVSGAVLLESACTNAPGELKTRAQLEPGTPAFLEEAGMAESNSQVKNAGPFPDIPLAVLAATDHGPYFRQWEPTLMHLQQELATLSPRATLIVAQGSGHDIQLDRPNMVVDAVRQIATAAKN